MNNIIIDNDYSNTQTYDGIHIRDGNYNNNTIIQGNRIGNNDRYEIYIEGVSFHAGICFIFKRGI